MSVCNPVFIMPGGSTKKTCPFCQSILFCAQKICAHCLKEQPTKQRLEKKLKRFDEKREDWGLNWDSGY
ncbi:hypothetical protein F7725_009419 [Dissostichus mawsoni]|uniref:Uncharacterized protein n=1 Tax=Dissostichus mawsoni TaxID=36200 RepID=A0A7J5XL15_DISMA|nr:hypothetical protein F7725_009419 [Dissostichus mawsoni]